MINFPSSLILFVTRILLIFLSIYSFDRTRKYARVTTLPLRAFLLALFSFLRSFLLGLWFLLRAFSHTHFDRHIEVVGVENEVFGSGARACSRSLQFLCVCCILCWVWMVTDVDITLLVRYRFVHLFLHLLHIHGCEKREES